jgi:hypothetical protein
MRSRTQVRGIPLLISFALVGLAAFFLLATAFGDFAHGSANGPDDGYAGNPPDFLDCTVCHFDYAPNSGDGALQIMNLPPAFVPGSTYTLMIALTDPGQERWGFELTVLDAAAQQAGTLVVTDAARTQLSDNVGSDPDFIKHTFAGTDSGVPDAAPGWTFDWVAPNIPSVTFYIAGNAANFSEDPSGDYIYTRQYTIQQGATAADATSWGKVKALYSR